MPGETPTTQINAVPHVDSPPAADGGARKVGTLVLLGGNLTADGAALKAFIKTSGADQGARIVVLTLASAVPAEAEQYWRDVLAGRGVRNVVFPALDRTNSAIDASVAAEIDGADAVFMTGGDQVTLVTALSGTNACGALKQLYARGGVVAGTSAGAAALTELTMAGGEFDQDGNLVEQYLGPGLGLLGYQAIIDTHFSERRRLKRLFFVVAANTELFGLGIDENTALVVRGGIGEVVGAGGVTFVDGRETVRFDNAHELEAGRQLTLSHLRVGIIGTHYRLNMVERELHELTLVREPPPREPGPRATPARAMRTV